MREQNTTPTTVAAAPGSSRGFTMIEMAVTVAVSIFLFSIVLTQSTTSRSDIEVANVAYQLSVLIRSAQTYGTAVRASGGNFDDSYGIYANDAPPREILLFRDTSGNNNRYDAGADTVIETLTIPDNISFRVGFIQGGSTSWTVAWVSAAFKRPDPDALIYRTGSNTLMGGMLVEFSGDNFTHTVTVYPTGQVDVL